MEEGHLLYHNRVDGITEEDLAWEWQAPKEEETNMEGGLVF
jgi:uncharacterized protein (DUF427 family)